MAFNRRIHLVIAVLLAAIIRSYAQSDSINLEQQSSIDIAKFLKTEGGTPLFVISFTLVTTNESPCKVDIVWETNENGTRFDRYYQGYHPQRGRRNQKVSQSTMRRISLRGEFTHISTQADNTFNAMRLYQEMSQRQKQRNGEVPTEYGVEQMIIVSPNGNCSVFRSRLTGQESHFDLRVRVDSLTENSDINCLDTLQTILTNSRLLDSSIMLPTKQQIDACRADCAKHSACNPTHSSAA
uniref:Putative lipocalin-3 1 n=1 Tax=Amblyomma triste TaxID=251400 RepID=A0A023GEE3_AMBTT